MKPEKPTPKWLARAVFIVAAVVGLLSPRGEERGRAGRGDARGGQVKTKGHERSLRRTHPLVQVTAAANDKTNKGAKREEPVPMTRENRVLSSVLVGLVVLAGLGGIMKFSGRTRIPEAPQYTLIGAEPDQAPAAFTAYGCPACHTIAGVDGQDGKVGPVLDAHFAKQAYIAGKLANTPDNLTTWLRFPQSVEPGTAMPNLGVTESAARDMAAYLYSLR